MNNQGTPDVSDLNFSKKPLSESIARFCWVYKEAFPDSREKEKDMTDSLAHPVASPVCRHIKRNAKKRAVFCEQHVFFA